MSTTSYYPTKDILDLYSDDTSEEEQLYNANDLNEVYEYEEEYEYDYLDEDIFGTEESTTVESVTPQPSVSSSSQNIINPFNIPPKGDNGTDKFYYRVIPKSNDRGPVDEDVDTLTRLAAAPSAAGGETKPSAIDPEKLAYILIGVCCGLSLLCLVLVAVSIGYKSETHYRLENGSINASSSKRGTSRWVSTKILYGTYSQS